MYSLFQEWRLPPSRLSATTPMGGAEDAVILPLVVQTYRALSMAAFRTDVRTGETTQRIGDMNSLLDRMRSEIAEARAVVIMPTAVTVWNSAPECAKRTF